MSDGPGMSDNPDSDPAHEPGAGGSDDVEERIARRRAERSRGTPAGRDPLPGRAHTGRLLILTLALVGASAVVLVGVALLAG